jgi:hypothetical protein
VPDSNGVDEEAYRSLNSTLQRVHRIGQLPGELDVRAGKEPLEPDAATAATMVVR